MHISCCRNALDVRVVFPLSERRAARVWADRQGPRLNSVVMVTETLERISYENKSSAENCASPHTASLLLMDMNIYLCVR